jgi:hypothetical protein
MMTIQGYCPMGCGQTLFLGSGGYVTCSYLQCPKPDAVSVILADIYTDHVVEFGDTEFTVKHPLKERLNDALFTCELHTYIAGMDGPPVSPGRYFALPRGDRWTWQRLEAS